MPKRSGQGFKSWNIIGKTSKLTTADANKVSLIFFKFYFCKTVSNNYQYTTYNVWLARYVVLSWPKKFFI